MQKTVIITGAANGIGKAITERCLQEGFRVLACDINAQDLASLETSHSAYDLSVATVDIADYQQVLTFFDQVVKKEDNLSCLVNNAGIYLGRNILDYSFEDMQRVIQVNCLGAIYFSQQFAKLLLPAKQAGIIVNMTSVSGQEGSSDAVYGLSKAALIGLTKSCAMNFAPYIRVNAVAPALVTTDMISHVPAWRLEEYRAGELVKDPILPQDVADTVVFLLSDQSKHYTGAVFDINNGQYRR